MLKENSGDLADIREPDVVEQSFPELPSRIHRDWEDGFDDDFEFLDHLPPLLPFLPNDGESGLGVEDRHPVLGFSDGDGPPEEGQADLTDRFGDEEEVRGRGRRSGFCRFGVEGMDVWDKGEFENPFDDFERESERFRSHG